ncbi:MAG: hypothetical protein ACRDRX_16345 [Pseudonocardiaceae bacterium]
MGGSVLLVVSYHHAAALTTGTDQLTFALYWAGFLTGMLSLTALGCATRIDELTRMFALVGLALFGTLPKLLRNPTGPLGTDEYAHTRQILEAYLNGDVGHVSYQLPITQGFPGLHQAVSTIAHLSGLSLWTVGLGVIVLAHVLSVLGSYQLVRGLGASPSGAAIGAVVYTLNPSWVLFDASVAYESLALPLLIWCLAAAVTAARGVIRFRPRYIAVAAFAAMVIPVVHHLTTIISCALLVALTCASVAFRGRPALDSSGVALPSEKVWPLAIVTFCALGATAVWFARQLKVIITYLSPSLTRGWTQLSQIVGLSPRSESSDSGGRSLFAGTRLPFYEVLSAFMFPVVVFAAVLVAGYVIWRNRRQVGSAVWVFGALASLFFLSLPALFTMGGTEGAHRSWAFSFIGIAVICGVACSFSVHRDDATFGEEHRNLPGVAWLAGLFRSPNTRVGVAGAVFVVMAVGAMAAGQEDVSVRFPGAPRVGDDVRSINPQGRAVSDWVAAQTPIDTPVLADRYASFELGAYGRMAALSPSPAFPLWDMFIMDTPISPEVLKELHDSKIRYIVVDRRMATARPALGYWFTMDEPGANSDHLYPASALDRFNCLPWLQAMYGAGPLIVYRVDRDLLIHTMAGECREQAVG